MATCKDCLHYDICSSIEGLVLRVILAGDKANERCQLFKPTADVVTVETAKAWLLKMAKLNKNNVLDAGFSAACEELAANIDELKKFAVGGCK